ncbi:hypothetical protein CEP52_012727 [Fusarium oligoseptatum]|uniref:Uncharacterized protein n=1 Tax=Fusarium oligoseptatum TaxID=2604345 RepID=A0A428SX36_9HYPO|nr:hypothetical protein CEP52_012727 [Fusarium oligoseptatum]
MREGLSGADGNTMMILGDQIEKIAKADTNDIDGVKGKTRIERLDGQHDDLPDGLRTRNDKQRKNAGLEENVIICKKTGKHGIATPITQTEKDAEPEGKVRDGIEGKKKPNKLMEALRGARKTPKPQPEKQDKKEERGRSRKEKDNATATANQPEAPPPTHTLPPMLRQQRLAPTLGTHRLAPTLGQRLPPTPENDRMPPTDEGGVD